ncbi:hypothetical protein GUJ93_ZPchr0009g2325 [Zizania palustris]|uniref:Uncharacterized protein n=1 Tax=Zizania palustris TaxID=103762 RepID=A0A8J5VK76_ZIZPA|nr:hypothetical protein GUJ93_ZPchr0009g2325 [Zizania palustris]
MYQRLLDAYITLEMEFTRLRAMLIPPPAPPDDDDEMIDADGLADDDIEMELDDFFEDPEIAEADLEQESEEEELVE